MQYAEHTMANLGITKPRSEQTKKYLVALKLSGDKGKKIWVETDEQKLLK